MQSPPLAYLALKPIFTYLQLAYIAGVQNMAYKHVCPAVIGFLLENLNFSLFF